MALVAGYSSDEDEDMSETNFPTQSTTRAGPSKVHAAPEVSLEVPFCHSHLILDKLTISGPNAIKTNAHKTFRH